MNSNSNFSSKEIEEFRALLSLTNLYVSQNFEDEGSIFTEKETFKDYPLLAKEKPKQNPASFSAAPPPSPPVSRPALKPIEIKPKGPAIVKEEKEIEKDRKKPSVSLETASFSVPHETFSDLKSLMKALFPKQVILDDPPKEMGIENTKFLVVFTKETEKELLFLGQLVKALSLMGAPAALLSSSDKKTSAFLKNGSVKLMIGTKEALDKTEHPSSLTVVTLMEISDYLEHPEKKASLWNAIKNAY